MKLDDALAALGELDCLDTVRERWEESASTLPARGPRFLRPEEPIAPLKR